MDSSPLLEPLPDDPPASGRVFTEYVRLLATGQAVGRALLLEVWDALRVALRRELRRRGLWDARPHYLGIFGFDRWDSRRDGALEELLAECFAFTFVERLPNLCAHLASKANIDGLVIRNIRNLLHDRQEKHDPIGFQVFSVAQTALRQACAAGELFLVSGDPALHNETVLSFSVEARLAPVGSPPFRAVATRWSQELLPDLVTLRGRRQDEAVGRLRRRLPELREEGVEVFRLRDLIDPLKAEVRGRWAALLEPASDERAVDRDDDAVRLIQLVRPDSEFEEEQLFRRLVACVLEAVACLEAQERTRRHLTTLWQFVRFQAMDPAARVPPSMRKLSEVLGIPRERFPDLYETLGFLLERCRAAHSGSGDVLLLSKSRRDRAR